MIYIYHRRPYLLIFTVFLYNQVVWLISPLSPFPLRACILAYPVICRVLHRSVGSEQLPGPAKSGWHRWRPGRQRVAECCHRSRGLSALLRPCKDNLSILQLRKYLPNILCAIIIHNWGICQCKGSANTHIAIASYKIYFHLSLFIVVLILNTY